MFTPAGTIYLLNNQQLDNTYQNTFKFNSLAEQVNYFLGDVFAQLDDYTYIKDNTLKIEFSRETLYNVNYLMYHNTNEGKWIFCFIKDKIYINETTTELIIETDVMQTFQFDYTFLPSFVEREHIPASEDANNSNFVEEGLETGLMVSDLTSKTGKNNLCIIMTLVSEDGCTVSQGMLTACRHFAYHNTNAGAIALASKIKELTTANKTGNILSIAMASELSIGEFTDGVDVSNKGIGMFEMSYSKPTSLNGYIPKNKKLLHYPYCYLEVNTPAGKSLKYLYEFFSDATCKFNMYANMGVNCSVMLTPANYKNELLNINESITIDNYPQCAYVTDSFKIWLSRQIPQLAGDVMSLGVSALLAPATGGISLGMGVASTLGSVTSSVMGAIREPNKIEGSYNSNMLAGMGEYDFRVSKRTILAERARQIDDYFTMYGYKVSRLKTPYLTSRPIWNYVKTNGCNLNSAISTNDLIKIKTIYDEGVTLWHFKGSKIEINYSQNNM